MALKFEDIKDEFLTRLRRDREATALMASIESGSATYATATQYAARVGEILGQVLKFNAPITDISDWDIDDLIPGSLGLDHRIVTNACRAVQETMNRDAGIGIRYQEPTFDWDRVHGIVDELRDNPEFINIEETFYDQITNFSQSVVDSSVRANAAVASGAGIKTWVIRTASSNACKWCRAAAGRFNYEDVKGTGNDVWRRHENCNCTIDYMTERNGSTYRERVYRGGEESTYTADQYFENGTSSSKLRKRDGASVFDILPVENSEVGIKTAGVELSLGQIDYFDRSITEISSIIEDNGYDRPQVVVVPESGLSSTSAIASYNAVDNTLRVFEGLADAEQRELLQSSGACPDNSLSTLLHEYIHWNDACEYQKTHGAITADNVLQYLEYRNALARELLGDNFSVDDAKAISDYAFRSYLRESYDEVYTELRVRSLLEN